MKLNTLFAFFGYVFFVIFIYDLNSDKDIMTIVWAATSILFLLISAIIKNRMDHDEKVEKNIQDYATAQWHYKKTGVCSHGYYSMNITGTPVCEICKAQFDLIK